MAVLSWKHHTLIQALLSQGPISESDFNSIFDTIIGKNPREDPHELKNYLLIINKELSQFQIELRCFRDQNNGDVCYAIANNSPDGQSKLGTKYSAPQIALFKSILEAIIDDDSCQGSISNIRALNISLENAGGTASQVEGNTSEIVPALKNFTMGQKEKTIEELAEDKWIYHASDGRIGLGTKSYLDLRSWFLNSGVPSCQFCNEVAVKAMRCQSEGCSNRIHDYCLKNRAGQSLRTKCEGCGLEWPTSNSVVVKVEGENTQIAANFSRKKQPKVERKNDVASVRKSKRTRSSAH